MNKFEQVGGRAGRSECGEEGGRDQGVPMWVRGGALRPSPLITWGPDLCVQTERQTNMVENITFPQTTYAGGKYACKTPITTRSRRSRPHDLVVPGDK